MFCRSRAVFMKTYDSRIFTHLAALCWKPHSLNNRDEFRALY